MGIRDRLRRLEDRFRDWGPMPEEVQTAWGRIAERTRATLRGEPTDDEQAIRDRDTVERWARAEGADLENEVQKAKH